MADIIKATRGLKVDFEEVQLLLGEPGLATDEERLYIGGNNGNIPLPNAADLSERVKQNTIINGDFRINQRAVSGTVTLTAGQYGHDRWKAGASGCTYTFATVGGVTTITITVGSLIQIIEGTNLQTGTYVLSWSGTSQGKIGAGSYSASGITASVTGGTNLSIEFGVGTIANIKFEKGSFVTPFRNRDIGEELILSRRYGETIDKFRGNTGYVNAGGYFVIHYPFNVKKRVAPIVILPTDLTNAIEVVGNANATPTSLNVYATTEGLRLIGFVNTSFAGNPVGINFSTIIYADSEL